MATAQQGPRDGAVRLLNRDIASLPVNIILGDLLSGPFNDFGVMPKSLNVLGRSLDILTDVLVLLTS